MSAPRVIVTGAKGLLGSATCEYLANKGYDVVEVDLALGHDLNDEAFTRDWFSRNTADGLVNLFALNDHVGSGTRAQTFLDVSLSSFSEYMQTNVTALFSACREFMRSNDRGVIVNASSIYGVRAPRPSLYGGGEKHPGYGASKSAVIALTGHLAVHAAPDFRVNCLVIGGVQKDQPAQFIDRYAALVPLGRMAQVEDVPPVIDFLLSPSSRYMTGAVVSVDGGWSV